MNPRLSVNEYARGIIKGDRVILAKALTLVESNLKTDQEVSMKLLGKLKFTPNQSIRIGITGVPGVGKSTFIESFGGYLTRQKKKVAVLTIDPTSQLSKGSILGDKTRMEELARNPMAFIRPSSSGGAMGGTTQRTREAIFLCEAAGFEIVIIETVGVGQSETAVRGMVDFFLLLMLAGAGDELQGIKRGIMEMADALIITKADGENSKRAKEAAAEYRHALHLFRENESGWKPRVLTCSAIENKGIEEIWDLILQFKKQLVSNGHWKLNRQRQQVQWLHEVFDYRLKQYVQQSKRLKSLAAKLEKEVLAGKKTPVPAAEKLLAEFKRSLSK